MKLTTVHGGQSLGASPNIPDGPVTLHDFRHTCATRKARLGWNEAQLRAYFGWAPTSKMPARYVHLALQDMRDLVRQNAGVDDHGYAEALDVGDDAAALAAIMSRLMARKADGRTRPSTVRR